MCHCQYISNININLWKGYVSIFWLKGTFFQYIKGVNIRLSNIYKIYTLEFKKKKKKNIFQYQTHPIF